nr:hypothetical protein [Psychrobacter sp. PraFG1]UNK05235.1 hypothetical protein MN210_15010 [Psychrobacter sp. PraFG1]
MTKNTTTNHQNNPNSATSEAAAPLNATANFARFGSGMTAHLKAWITALQKANDLLPSNLRFDDVDFEQGANDQGKISLSLIEQLEDLPVFALSVVVQKQALRSSDGSELDKKATLKPTSLSGRSKTLCGKLLKWCAVPMSYKTTQAVTA